MNKLKIGVLKETKIPKDERVAISPYYAKKIAIEYGEKIELFIQKSDVRRYKDIDYTDLELNVVDNIDNCDILIGVKEVNINTLIENKTYIFFSHTIKEQEHNRNLLKTIIDKNIRLIDWETIRNDNGKRIIGFGRFAGIIGTYNTLMAYGIKNKAFELKEANKCENLVELYNELLKVKFTEPQKILVTGKGKVGNGILEVLKELKIREVNKIEFLNNNYDETVYLNIDIEDYNARNDGEEFDKLLFYNEPQKFHSDFYKYCTETDIYIAGHFWNEHAPGLITHEDTRRPDFKINIIGDISCDIDGPIASTIRASTIDDRFYGYNSAKVCEVKAFENEDITVMAVDNLPCELPKDSSDYFSDVFFNTILPLLIDSQSNIIKNSVICENKKLTKKFAYLQEYVDGNTNKIIL